MTKTRTGAGLRQGVEKGPSAPPSRWGFRAKHLIAGIAVALLGCVELSAQQTGISGRVTDPSGASIPTVTVTATGDDSSKFSTVTNGQGLYQFPALRAAKYVVRIEAPGFSVAEHTITLAVGQLATVDISLKVAAAASSVDVEARAEAVDTTSSTVAGDVSPTEVSKLPLNGRN